MGVYIKDLSGYVVNNADDMDRIMTLGHKNRKHVLLFACFCAYTYFKQQQQQYLNVECWTSQNELLHTY